MILDSDTSPFKEAKEESHLDSQERDSVKSIRNEYSVENPFDVSLR